MDSSSSDWHFPKRRHTETHSVEGYKTTTRDWSDATVSQGTPRLASNHQMLGERHGTDALSEPPQAATLPASLRNCEGLSCCFKPPSLWAYVMVALGN